MDIKIDKDFSLKSDLRNVILVKTYTGKSGEAKGKIQEEPIGYYATIQQALKSYLKIKINLSDATTIQEILDDIAKIEKTIEEVLRGN